MKPQFSRQHTVHRLITIACALWIPQITLQMQAQILDGGFENVTNRGFTNNLPDGWVVTQGSIGITKSDTALGAVAHGGRQFADLDQGTGSNTIAQTLTTVPNQTYTLSYWIADTSPDPFTVIFDGAVLFDGTAPTAGVTSSNDYVQYMFTVASISSNALLSFTGRYTSSGGTLGTILDDVSFTPATPPILSIVSDGLGNIQIQWPNMGSYILEQSTNVATTNWTAGSYTITNNVLTNFCTVIPAGEDLFFRLKQQLP